jgi:hypothetical protein
VYCGSHSAYCTVSVRLERLSCNPSNSAERRRPVRGPAIVMRHARSHRAATCLCSDQSSGDRASSPEATQAITTNLCCNTTKPYPGGLQRSSQSGHGIAQTLDIQQRRVRVRVRVKSMSVSRCWQCHYQGGALPLITMVRCHRLQCCPHRIHVCGLGEHTVEASQGAASVHTVCGVRSEGYKVRQAATWCTRDR